MSLFHALGAAREVARREDGQVWRQLEARLDGLLQALHGQDPDHHVGSDPRLDREQIDETRGQEVMAALLPLAEAPDEQRASVALDRLDLLDGAAGHEREPAPPEPDPALTDEGW